MSHIAETTTDFTQTWDTEQVKPNRLAVQQVTDDGYPPRIWRFVHNDSGSPFVEGSVVAIEGLNPGGSPNVDEHELATTDCTVRALAGVAQHTIADGEYGWVLVSGIGEVEAGTGAITLGNSLVVDSTDAGHAMDAAAATDDAFAVALESAAAGNLATCLISCPLF